MHRIVQYRRRLYQRYTSGHTDPRKQYNYYTGRFCRCSSKCLHKIDWIGNQNVSPTKWHPLLPRMSSHYTTYHATSSDHDLQCVYCIVEFRLLRPTVVMRSVTMRAVYSLDHTTRVSLCYRHNNTNTALVQKDSHTSDACFCWRVLELNSVLCKWLSQECTNIQPVHHQPHLFDVPTHPNHITSIWHDLINIEICWDVPYDSFCIP